MNIILTGAAGFLGSHLVKAWLAQGHRIVALKRSRTDLRRLSDVMPDVVFYDVEDLDLAHPFTENGPIDAVIHTATCYGRAGESATQIFEANTTFPLRLLEAALTYNTDIFINTDTILNPYINAYALSKKHFADWGRQLATPGRMRFVNLRLEHLYGPDDDPSKFPTWVVQSCLANVPVIPLTVGEQRRDFVYITDAVSAYSLLLQRSRGLQGGFQEFGLSSGAAVTIRDFVELVHRQTQSTSRLSFGALPYRVHEPMEPCAEIPRLTAMGWRCVTSLEEGISKMIENLKQ